jgi:hypothetical protein
MSPVPAKVRPPTQLQLHGSAINTHLSRSSNNQQLGGQLSQLHTLILASQHSTAADAAANWRNTKLQWLMQ